MTWYDTLREQHRPKEIGVLFVGESPPDPGASEKRFFYSPTLFPADNLFRGLMLALYNAGPSQLRASKPYWLNRFKEDGFWLEDLTDRPVNHLSDSDRRRARLDAVPDAIARIRTSHASIGVVVCHTPTFAALSKSLETGPGGLLHDRPIPFPLGNHRAQFVELVRQAVGGAGVKVPLN